MEVERRARELYSEACQNTVAEANRNGSNPPRTVRIRSWDSLGRAAREPWYALARDRAAALDAEKRMAADRLHREGPRNAVDMPPDTPVVCRVNGCTNPRHFHPVVVIGGRTDRGPYPSRLNDANRRIRQLEDELQAALRREDVPGMQREIIGLKAQVGILQHKLEAAERGFRADDMAARIRQLERELDDAVQGRNYVTREDYNRLLAAYDRAAAQAKADVASLRGAMAGLEHANAAVTRDRDLALSREADRQKSLNAAHERINELERRNVKLGQRLSGQHPTQDYRNGYADGVRVGKLKAGTRALMLLNQQRPTGASTPVGRAVLRGYDHAARVIANDHERNGGTAE